MTNIKKLTKEDLHEIEMIYRTQLEQNPRTIQLNIVSFKKLLEFAKAEMNKS